MDAITGALETVSGMEWLGVVLALAYLLLAVRQNSWCWLFAAVSSVVYLWVFAVSGLTMQAALQVFYLAMAAYGWRTWRREPGAGTAQRPVVSWPLRSHVLAFAAIAAATLINVLTLHGEAGPADGESMPTGRPVAYVDAFVAWGSVLTTWMVARKVLENWLYWIVIDLTAAGLYWSQGLYATAVLFVLYALIAVRGFLTWRTSRAEPVNVPTRAADATG